MWICETWFFCFFLVQMLIAGDKKGNITAFPFPKILVDSGLMQQKMPPCDRFKGAHGISSVTSVHIKDSISDHIEIHTVCWECRCYSYYQSHGFGLTYAPHPWIDRGRWDGCICFFKYGKNVQKIEFFGMKQVKELGTIQSMYTNVASESQLSSTYAIGFTSADFIIWDLENETKVTQHEPYELASQNQQFS